MREKYSKKTFPRPTENFHQKIVSTLESLPEEKENVTMKKPLMKRRFAIPVAALMMMLILGTTALATGKIESLTSVSSAKATYIEMPQQKELNSDLGYEIKQIDTFENGYTFAEGTIGKGESLDADGNVLESQKEYNSTYKKNGEEVWVSAIKQLVKSEGKDGTVIAQENGIDFIYNSYANKSVAGDYVMTEQDKKDEASGKYVFSFGIEKESIDEVQGVTWSDNDITYNITAVNSSLSQDDLLAMAKELMQQ